MPQRHHARGGKKLVLQISLLNSQTGLQQNLFKELQMIRTQQLAWMESSQEQDSSKPTAPSHTTDGKDASASQSLQAWIILTHHVRKVH